jgi:hypothetical protein
MHDTDSIIVAENTCKFDTETSTCFLTSLFNTVPTAEVHSVPIK